MIKWKKVFLKKSRFRGLFLVSRYVPAVQIFHYPSVKVFGWVIKDGDGWEAAAYVLNDIPHYMIHSYFSKRFKAKRWVERQYEDLRLQWQKPNGSK